MDHGWRETDLMNPDLVSLILSCRHQQEFTESPLLSILSQVDHLLFNSSQLIKSLSLLRSPLSSLSVGWSVGVCLCMFFCVHTLTVCASSPSFS